jgi:hypothetical protein
VIRATLLTALVIVCAAGCGDDEPAAPVERPAALTAQERQAADRAVRAIRAYCRGVARYLAGRAEPPAQANARAGAHRIAALARERPDAPYRGRQTARDLAGDLAEDLEGTNCSPALVATLARGL